MVFQTLRKWIFNRIDILLKRLGIDRFIRAKYKQIFISHVLL